MHQLLGFQEISGLIELREGTFALLLRWHARRSAFLMPIAGAKSGEVRGSKIRQWNRFWGFRR